MVMTPSTPSPSPRRKVPAVYMRGGSSKALFFKEEDIPAPGPARDRLLIRLMGSPDPMQIDGMGGTKAVTSKIAIIRTSSRPDADVDYTFAQVGMRDAVIEYKANCGNISAGVGPFAIEEGLIDGKESRKGTSIDDRLQAREVRIYNTNTDKILIAHVPVDEYGLPVEKGDFQMAGVPGTGAPILMDYRATIGASQGKGVLPTGHTRETVNVQGRDIPISIVDVGNPMIFFKAEDLGMTGHETAAEITGNAPLIQLTRELRGKAAMILRMCTDWHKVDEQCLFIPAPVAVARPKNTETGNHISGRLFIDNTCHDSMAASGATCMAAASRTPGTLVYDLLDDQARGEETLRIEHPLGMMPVVVKTTGSIASTEGSTEGSTGETTEGTTEERSTPQFETLSFVRTARRIMEGKLMVPKGFVVGDGDE